MTAILGYLVNSAVRTLLFGYFGRKIYRPWSAFHWRRWQPELTLCARLTADSIINYLNTNLSTLVLARILGAGVAGDANLGVQRGRCATDEAEPNHHPRVVSGVRQNSGRHRKLRVNLLLLSVVGLSTFRAARADGGVE